MNSLEEADQLLVSAHLSSPLAQHTLVSQNSTTGYQRFPSSALLDYRSEVGSGKPGSTSPRVKALFSEEGSTVSPRRKPAHGIAHKSEEFSPTSAPRLMLEVHPATRNNSSEDQMLVCSKLAGFADPASQNNVH